MSQAIVVTKDLVRDEPRSYVSVAIIVQCHACMHSKLNLIQIEDIQ